MLEFDRFPFYVGLREPDDAGGLPSTLPFCLAVDENTAIPRVLLTPEILTALDKAYANGSLLSTPLGVGDLGQERMDEMLGGLLSAFGGEVAGRRRQ